MVAGSSSKLPEPEVDMSGSKRLITDTRVNVLTSSANAVLSNDDLLIEILLLLPAISLFLYKALSNNRIPSKISNVFTFSSKEPDKILVYNPCINLFKILPRPQIYVQPHITFGGIRLVFDPTKSPNYKVVHAGLKTDDDFNGLDGGDFYIQIQTYSSETGKWSVCVNRFGFKRFHGFNAGIYSNGALHWLNFANGRYWHVKLDILLDHPVLTTIQLPVPLDGEVFCDHKFFESRGCLLLVCKNCPDSCQLNIFEMRNGYSEWSMKYLVNLDDIMMPFPRNWWIRSSFWCIVLGEREEDSFMVFKSYEKVLQYKIVLETVHTLFDLESTSPRESFPFIASFTRV
ncbi:hypothetical protein Tco_0549093 [Tanacetum coccineum]